MSAGFGIASELAIAKSRTLYACRECGYTQPRWSGQCPECRAWNSFGEETRAPRASLPSVRPGAVAIESLAGGADLVLPRRLSTAQSLLKGEFDRVLGGGIVPGSAVLLGGDPGIGKSTLVLQALAALSHGSGALKTLYTTGEESLEQVRMRAARLGVSQVEIQLGALCHVESIVALIESSQPPAVVVVDSVQTAYSDALDSAPGTVGQVRSSAFALVQAAKRRGVVLILVGHVTKDNMLAGPRVLEHLVDAVLYFESSSGQGFRLLRAVKNRFGATDEIGVFEMLESGRRRRSRGGPHRRS